MVCLLSDAWAQETEKSGQTAEELSPVIVTAQKGSIANADVIPVEEIQTPSFSGSLLESLENQAGIQLKRSNMDASGNDTLRIRGIDQSRLTILKDGIFLNRDGSYGNGTMDWGLFGTDGVEAIEIYRGSCPAKYGNTLGGVINIVTKVPTEKPETTAHISGGSEDAISAGASHSWKKGPLGWSLAVDHFESDGYLRNNSTDRNNFSANILLDLPARWEIGVGVQFSQAETGLAVYNRPDSPYFDASYPIADEKALRGPGLGQRLLSGSQAWGNGSKTEDTSANYTAYIKKAIGTGYIKLDGRFWNQESTETYVDAANPSKLIYERETDGEDDNWSLKGEFGYRLGTHSIEAGAETRSYGWGAQRVTYIDQSYFNGSINFLAFYKNGFLGQEDIMAYHALYLQDTWQITPEISLDAGLRQEWFKADSVDPDAFGYTWSTGVNELEEDHLDPRLGVRWKPFEQTILTARWGIAHRYPTSPEYFWWYLNNQTGYFNTSFNSERAIQYELGWEQKIGSRFSFFTRAYYYDIEDYIGSVSVTGVGTVYFNIDQVDIKGVEAGFSAKLPLYLTAWANLTWQEGEKEGDPWDVNNNLSNEVPDLPEVMANMGLRYNYKEKIRAGVTVSYVHAREHFKDDVLVKLDDYILVNVSAAYRIFQKRNYALDLELVGENVFDESYQEEDGYPMPGATVMAGIRMIF